MIERIKSRIHPYRNTINVSFFLLDVTTIMVIVIGLIDLILNLNLLNYILFSVTALVILITGTIVLFRIFRKNEIKLNLVRKGKSLSFKLIPVIIGIFADIDQDGDFDIALCNSDWDTAENEEQIIWYDNPGTGTPAQRDPWPKHIIFWSDEFYSKGQVALYNLTPDPFPELLIQTDNHLYIFKNPQNPQINDTWELIKIPKVPEACWYSRPIKVGDINNDTKPDILGMLTHRNGALPMNIAAVFWMEYSGTDPLSPSANWTIHMIKWGEGFLGSISNGEKWDQCTFEDVDRDGDLDIVANNEECNTLGFVFISVVWFENPLA